jgi:hypothetical protein
LLVLKEQVHYLKTWVKTMSFFILEAVPEVFSINVAWLVTAVRNASLLLSHLSDRFCHHGRWVFLPLALSQPALSS